MTTAPRGAPSGSGNLQVEGPSASEYGTTAQLLQGEAVWKSGLQNSPEGGQREFTPLPPKEEALELIHEAFRDFNAAFPLFDGPSFLRRVEVSYPVINAEDAAWWACLNVVLAFALRLRALRAFKGPEGDKAMWSYATNALGVVNELNMSSDLSAVQALLGMAIVLQGTPYSGICTALLASAIKSAHRLGIHRDSHEPCGTQVDREQQKRVFWIAYFLDQDICVRTGLPPTQYYDDMDVGLPLTTTEPGQGYTEDIRFFNYRIGLAIIQGHIYSELMSVKAMKKPAEKRSYFIQEFYTMLLRWKGSLSTDSETRHCHHRFDMQHPTTVLHAIILQFSYFNSMLTIYLCTGCERGVTEENPSTCGILQETGEALRTTLIVEARKSIELMKIIPLGNNACAWLLVGSVAPVVTVLLEEVIENPEHPLAHSDLQLIEPVLEFLESLARQVEYEDVKRIYDHCTALTRGAKAVFDISLEVNRIFPTRTLFRADNTSGVRE
ncbi:hypothetical protein N7449_002280 [Penicillium cf. viridicatum]|uniref:Xylanolytic transcriptional activator regulatory domain-containing protein n=1 Tax=Penicillium cf. viridicatum TaxID=2972119 RepID=A0A9W9MUU1_9EURO|nr:hypothetical protein N7449_002280 [Penicillium cf. viridicatum]